uniref:Uncharacterized protein n=1 Tax=Anopheles atroparvus TaxID=41427 RepID=A0A182IKM7_ANOAO
MAESGPEAQQMLPTRCLPQLGSASVESISSVTSMSFLSDENLTFHRFSDGTITFTSERKKSMENALNGSGAPTTMMSMATGGLPKPDIAANGGSGVGGANRTIERTRKHSYTQATANGDDQSPIWTTNASFNNYTTNTITNSNRRQQRPPGGRHGSGRDGPDSGTSATPAGPTTTAGIPTLGDLRYLSTPSSNPNNSSVIQNGSTVKLISTKASANTVAASDDQTNKQRKGIGSAPARKTVAATFGGNALASDCRQLPGHRAHDHVQVQHREIGPSDRQIEDNSGQSVPKAAIRAVRL